MTACLVASFCKGRFSLTCHIGQKSKIPKIAKIKSKKKENKKTKKCPGPLAPICPWAGPIIIPADLELLLFLMEPEAARSEF